jgi:hypothetical protein
MALWIRTIGVVNPNKDTPSAASGLAGKDRTRDEPSVFVFVTVHGDAKRALKRRSENSRLDNCRGERVRLGGSGSDLGNRETLDRAKASFPVSQVGHPSLTSSLDSPAGT